MDAFRGHSADVARTLFRRCVLCPSTTPSCPTCASGEICQLNPAVPCTKCASTSCVSAQGVDGASPTLTPAPQPSPAGPVAGGVVGGILVVALLTYLAWRFCVRPHKRRQQSDQRPWTDYNMGSEKSIDAQHRSQRASTHTVASFASSALTRASNIIPIAYIPGVTNRSVHSSQDLVPPVPPIPAASPGGSPMLDGEESHYFVPRDLHDTAYGGPGDHRTSMARTSIASTIYRNNAIVSPVPAQMASRAKPTAVSVRSNQRSPVISRSSTPPVPSVPSSAQSLNPPQSSIVGRVGVPRPVQIKKSSSLRKMQSNYVYELDGSDSGSSPARKPSADANMSPNLDDASDDESGAGHHLVKPSRTARLTTDTASDYGRGPRDTTDLAYARQGSMVERSLTSPSSLNQIIEEAALQASRVDAHTNGSRERPSPAMSQVHSPFSDEHAARTP